MVRCSPPNFIDIGENPETQRVLIDLEMPGKRRRVFLVGFKKLVPQVDAAQLP